MCTREMSGYAGAFLFLSIQFQAPKQKLKQCHSVARRSKKTRFLQKLNHFYPGAYNNKTTQKLPVLKHATICE